MTAHPQENPDAYEGAGMDAEMDARKRGCITDAGREADISHHISALAGSEICSTLAFCASVHRCVHAPKMHARVHVHLCACAWVHRCIGASVGRRQESTIFESEIG